MYPDPIIKSHLPLSLCKINRTDRMVHPDKAPTTWFQCLDDRFQAFSGVWNCDENAATRQVVKGILPDRRLQYRTLNEVDEGAVVVFVSILNPKCEIHPHNFHAEPL